MNTENLKLILEAIDKAGDGAFWIAAVAYGAEYWSALLTFAGVVTVAWVFARLIERCSKVSEFQNTCQRLCGLPTGEISVADEEHIYTVLRRGVQCIRDGHEGKE